MKKVFLKIKKFSEFINNKIAQIALFFVYVFAIIPTKILNLIFKRDRLRLKKQNKKSYWIKVEEKENNWDLQY